MALRGVFLFSIYCRDRPNYLTTRWTRFFLGGFWFEAHYFGCPFPVLLVFLVLLVLFIISIISGIDIRGISLGANRFKRQTSCMYLPGSHICTVNGEFGEFHFDHWDHLLQLKWRSTVWIWGQCAQRWIFGRCEEPCCQYLTFGMYITICTEYIYIIFTMHIGAGSSLFREWCISKFMHITHHIPTYPYTKYQMKPRYIEGQGTV